MILFKSIAICAVLLAGATQDNLHSLKHRPKLGDDQTIRVDAKLASDSFEFEVGMKINLKCTKVADDGGWTMASKLIEGKFKMSGAEEDLPAGESTDTSYDKNGKEIKTTSDEEDQDPFALIGEIYEIEPKAPVKIGAEWEIKTDFIQATPKLVSEETIDSIELLKIEMKGKVIKTDMSGDISGTIYVRKSNYEVYKADMVVKNAALGEGAPAGVLTVGVKTVK